MSDHNLTPFQRSCSLPVRRESYERLPMTCDTVRSILDAAKDQLMDELEIDPADAATVDAAISLAFCRIRDEVTQPFRDEHMRLIRDTGVSDAETDS